jgi:hypothetical protein
MSAYYDEYGFPLATTTGPRCGNCRDRHATADTVRDCYAITRAEQAEAAAEAAAENAYERYLENRGYDEAAAERAWEDARGVVQFEDAYRAACPWLFVDDCPEADLVFSPGEDGAHILTPADVR